MEYIKISYKYKDIIKKGKFKGLPVKPKDIPTHLDRVL